MTEPTPIATSMDYWRERVEQAASVATPLDERVSPFAYDAVEPDPEWIKAANWGRYAALIPARFQEATADQLDGELAQLVSRWVAGGFTSNALLLGNVGVGKTHAAIAMLRLAAEVGYSIRFSPVVELLDQLRPGSSGGDIEQALRPDVLVLDDLGGEKPTDWTAERLYAVVNRRWLEQRPTIATSNLDAEALEQAVGSRTWSRLYHGAERLKLAGSDRRRVA